MRKMAEGGPSPPDLETQRNEITTLLKKPLKKDDIWYLVDDKWFKQWKKYVGVDTWNTCSVGELSTHPGPIDNSPLFKDGSSSSDIKDHLIDELDYNLVPEEAWDLLVSWYGLTPGQKPIARSVIEHGMFVKHHKVEVYLLEFKLCENSNLDYVVTRKFSKADTIGKIEKEMRAIFNIPEDKEARLWNKYNSNTFDCLTNKDCTIQDAGLYAGQVLIIEQINNDGTWPRQVKSTSNVLQYSPASGSNVGENSRPYSAQPNVISTRSIGNNYSGSYSYDYHSASMSNAQPGLCGLSNLGNTCFMNSALQCMSNTPPLTEYFIEDKYWNELNTDNPLGMKGEIAKSYGELIKTMWSGRFSYTVPRNFKLAVGKFAPQFSGYQQQDCQELMAFLLDGLHEDLNRVKKKPYVELRDADGRPDEVVAKEAWDNYLKRNNSIIIDIFHGLLRSTLVCPKCKKISVTFDPFCYLSLPLPIKKERQIELSFIPYDAKKRPFQMKVTIPRNGTIQDICNSVCKMTSAPPEKLIVTDVYNHRLHKIFGRHESSNDIMEKDEIYVYEVPVAYPCEDPDTLVLPVYLKEKRGSRNSNVSLNPTELFGYPFMVAFSKKNLTADKLYETILRQLGRCVRIPETNDEWWNNYNDMENMNGEIDMTNGDDYDSDQPEDDKESIEMTEDDDKGSSKLYTMNSNRSVEMSEDDKGTPKLFTISTVNSNGNIEMDKLTSDVKVLKLTSKSYLAIMWNSKAKEKCYEEEEASKFEPHESLNTKFSQKKQVIQLGECLELFTTVEKLGVDDLWYCPVCKKHQQATKEFAMWSLPHVLIIHLKRFSYNRYCRDKLDTLVEFPVNGLNMAKYIINPQHGPAVYDLIAVANHYGGMGGGHYTAYAKNKDTHQWYYFDDNSVSPATEDSIVSKAAYVLFYMRRGPFVSNNNTQVRPSMPSTINTSTELLHSPNQDDDVESASSGEECMEVN